MRKIIKMKMLSQYDVNVFNNHCETLLEQGWVPEGREHVVDHAEKLFFIQKFVKYSEPNPNRRVRDIRVEE